MNLRSITKRIAFALPAPIVSLVCRVRGHCYEAPVINFRCLYYCVRGCGAEMHGRTWEDLTTLPPIDDDGIEQMEFLDHVDELDRERFNARCAEIDQETCLTLLAAVGITIALAAAVYAGIRT